MANADATKAAAAAPAANGKPAAEEKPAEPIVAKDPKDVLLAELRTIAALVERSVSLRESRFMTRALRQTAAARKRLTAPVLSTFIKEYIPSDSEARVLLTHLQGSDMDVDESDGPVSAKPSTRKGPLLPELEMYTYLITLIYLVDAESFDKAKACANAAVRRLQGFNRRTMDVIGARLCFYLSLSYEKTNTLAEIRSTLLALHRTATLRHDDVGQETLLNLLLRNYLYYSLYDQAEKLRSKTQRAESRSNHQFCRYLYYLGRIRAIQLEYTDAKECLLQAARKAPQGGALGFRIACNKWAIIVRLLLGEIPERTLFMQSGMKTALKPYFDLTQSVRVGNLEAFHNTSVKYATVFQADSTHNLIVRLRQNVIKTGLRRISLSYSRISLADIAKKLHLDAVEDAENIVTKAIRDGGIEATVSHESGWMQSKESTDIYSSQEPMLAFHSRVAFCLDIHNEAVKAMRFPPDAHKTNLETAEKRRERLQQEQELAKHIVEEDDEEF
eukprot:jgi/Chlat1/657/Chrsp103S01055